MATPKNGFVKNDGEFKPYRFVVYDLFQERILAYGGNGQYPNTITQDAPFVDLEARVIRVEAGDLRIRAGDHLAAGEEGVAIPSAPAYGIAVALEGSSAPGDYIYVRMF